VNDFSGLENKADTDRRACLGRESWSHWQNNRRVNAVGEGPHLALRVRLSLRERSEVRVQSMGGVTWTTAVGIIVSPTIFSAQ
jgi:hypothetical protein